MVRDRSDKQHSNQCQECGKNVHGNDLVLVTVTLVKVEFNISKSTPKAQSVEKAVAVCKDPLCYSASVKLLLAEVERVANRDQTTAIGPTARGASGCMNDVNR